MSAALRGPLGTSVHEEKITEALSEVRFDGTAPVLNKDLCILAFSNRSGSNFLGEQLASLPGSGGIGEQLNWSRVLKFSQKHKLDSFPAYIRKQAEINGGARLWVVKASPSQLSFLLRWNIPAMFRNTRIIHIRRNDLAAQAVSLQFANHTGVWVSRQNQLETADSDVPYDLPALQNKIHAVQAKNANIEILTTAAGLPFQTVVYGHLLEHPGQTMTDLAAFLDVDITGWTLPETRIKKQESDDKSRMVARLRKDLADIVLSDG